MRSLTKIIAATGVALGLTVSTFAGMMKYSSSQRRTPLDHLRDSAEVAMPRVKETITEITGVGGPLSVGYFSEPGGPAGLARGTVPSQTGSDSMSINTSMSASAFRAANYTLPQRVLQTVEDRDYRRKTPLGVMYHEASHVRYGQLVDSLSREHISVAMRRGHPRVGVLNEGTAEWVETRVGEAPPPRRSARVQNPDLIPAKLARSEQDIYTGGYNMVEPIIDSLGYRDGVTAMMTNDLPTNTEFNNPETYHQRILEAANNTE